MAGHWNKILGIYIFFAIIVSFLFFAIGFGSIMSKGFPTDNALLLWTLILAPLGMWIFSFGLLSRKNWVRNLYMLFAILVCIAFTYVLCDSKALLSWESLLLTGFPIGSILFLSFSKVKEQFK